MGKGYREKMGVLGLRERTVNRNEISGREGPFRKRKSLRRFSPQGCFQKVLAAFCEFAISFSIGEESCEKEVSSRREGRRGGGHVGIQRTSA